MTGQAMICQPTTALLKRRTGDLPQVATIQAPQINQTSRSSSFRWVFRPTLLNYWIPKLMNTLTSRELS